jgi:hypothetical protein
MVELFVHIIILPLATVNTIVFLVQKDLIADFQKEDMRRQPVLQHIFRKHNLLCISLIDDEAPNQLI